MSMTPRERIMAVLNGEEPDKIPVLNWSPSLIPGGWYRRLAKRGLGTLGLVHLYLPTMEEAVAGGHNPHLPDVKYTQIHYIENGIEKYRHTLETPVGHITGVKAVYPLPIPIWVPHTEEYFVKQPSDWRVVNYISKGVLDKLAPAYEVMERTQDELGDSGIVLCIIDRTPWQRAWLDWAGLERAVIDFHEQPEEVQEFIEIQTRLHTRLAEFAAECPAKIIDFGENMTDVTSPKYFREYSMPIYEIYGKQLEGTGKILGAHMDGRFGKIKKEIAETPLNVIESFTVPPVGDVSLAEAKKIWPDKMIFMNCPAHLHWAEPEEVRKGYEALADEWGSKKGIILELSEDVPPEKVEAHLSAAMDTFGY